MLVHPDPLILNRQPKHRVPLQILDLLACVFGRTLFQMPDLENKLLILILGVGCGPSSQAH